MFASVGLLVATEVDMGGADLRMDLVSRDVFAPAGSTVALDVRVSTSDEAVDVAEGEAVREKLAKYGARCGALGWSLSVFFVTASGVPGPATASFFDNMFASASRVARASFFRSLSAVLARSCGAALRACLPPAVLIGRPG
jgi:hypothetical protein